MSIYATNWAYEQPIKPAGRKFVLVAIANFADSEGRAFPGVGTLAKMTGQDERSVRRHIDALEEKGFIRSQERRRKDGSRTTDELWLQAPAEALNPASAATGQSVRKSTGQNARLKEQPDNLSGTTGQFDQTNRTICHPSPDNLSGHEPSFNHHYEPSLKKHLAADAAAHAPTPPEQATESERSQAVTSQVQPSAGEGTQDTQPAAGEEVPPAPRRAQPSAARRLIEVWNAHRGPLPEVESLSEGRRKAVKKLVRDCGDDVDRAAAVLADAAREVAGDEFWISRRYGFDNLVPGKVFQKAEAWHARAHRPAADDLATAPAVPAARKDWVNHE